MTTETPTPRSRPPKRDATVIGDVKWLLTAASVAATLGGWSMLSQGADPGDAAGAGVTGPVALAAPPANVAPAAAPARSGGTGSSPGGAVPPPTSANPSVISAPSTAAVAQATAGQRPRPVARTRASR